MYGGQGIILEMKKSPVIMIDRAEKREERAEFNNLNILTWSPRRRKKCNQFGKGGYRGRRKLTSSKLKNEATTTKRQETEVLNLSNWIFRYRDLSYCF